MWSTRPSQNPTHNSGSVPYQADLGPWVLLNICEPQLPYLVSNSYSYPLLHTVVLMIKVNNVNHEFSILLRIQQVLNKY